MDVEREGVCEGEEGEHSHVRLPQQPCPEGGCVAQHRRAAARPHGRRLVYELPPGRTAGHVPGCARVLQFVL